MQTAGLTPADVVLEVGPGLGVLTRELAKQAGWVMAVELDDKLSQILRETLTSYPNISIINRDILDVDPLSLIEEEKPNFPPSINNPHHYKLVADLPYYITSPVIRHFLEATLKPQVMVLMVQKEVAESITAKPGDMRILSVSVQFYGKPEIIGYVPARCFYPSPEVDSAILRVTPYAEPIAAVTDVKGFFKVVKAGFCTPRKQLINSLATGLDIHKEKVLPLLETAGVQPQRRAETLGVEEWAKLWYAYNKADK